MAASGILLCGIAEAVRPEVDLSVGVPADKVVIADGILDQETQNNTDESFCDRLMKKMVHMIWKGCSQKDICLWGTLKLCCRI